MKTILTFLAALPLFFSNGPAAESEPQTALRIVSLAPSLTEILFELGLGNQIVGVSNYCTYPPEALQKEKVGGLLNPNLEKIVGLAPDLIVAERWPSSRTVPRLIDFGLPVREFPSPKSLAQIFRLIREVGATVGRQAAAEEMIEGMQERLRLIARKAATLKSRPTVYVEIDLPSWTVGRTSFVTEALRICGFRNLFEDVDRSALLASKEVIIARDPQIIVSFVSKTPEIRARPGWTGIRAVREHRIVDDLEGALLSHGNHRLVEGMERLQERLLPLLGAADE